MAEDAAANAALIERFYGSFARHDGEEMARCYAEDARFSDPAFGELAYPEVTAMWRMFCDRAEETNLRVAFSDVRTDDDRGSAHWEADYTFTTTGRQVHNSIDASFRFRNGLIAEHVDSFSFWRWSRQALGPIGLALGWSPLVRGRVREQARQNLREFMASTG